MENRPHTKDIKKVKLHIGGGKYEAFSLSDKNEFAKRNIIIADSAIIQDPWHQITEYTDTVHMVIIDDGVRIGENTEIKFGASIGCGSYIGDFVKIGNFVIIEDGVSIDNDTRIGDNAKIRKKSLIDDSVSIASGVRIGCNTIIKGGVTIHISTHLGDDVYIGFSAEIGGYTQIEQKVKIGEYARIGTCARIQSNTSIKDNTIIGYGARITNKDNPKGLLITGFKAPLSYWGEDKVAIGTKHYTFSEWDELIKTNTQGYYYNTPQYQISISEMKDYDNCIQLIKQFHKLYGFTI
ncbi:hypothetical protein AAE02nite_03220 [Adhaeribacter aerolatus]|uniref:UDP-3-O-(3-hydroxymyristoyl)glucosamine N-acyltransferase n=1 Tax=Adhaeribacter aerolatus TaxID=670289 RepID=A0A512ASH4_9BACT|nr:hypothetical protein [Adhaeribacter aerolatus]GEO02658.1 hypothetical protein AAE02nite_03220 [Adhaeribacter aerolatus]